MSTRVKPPSRTNRSLLRYNSLCSTPSAVEPKSQTLDARMQERDRTLEECRITKFKKFDMEKKDLFDHQTMGFISRKNKAPRNHWDPSFTRPTGAHSAISTFESRQHKPSSLAWGRPFRDSITAHATAKCCIPLLHGKHQLALGTYGFDPGTHP